MRYTASSGDSPPRPKEQATSVPPFPTTDDEDSALNARHGTRAAFLFLQMQGFLQERGYVNLS
jgi:hypothetical protein